MKNVVTLKNCQQASNTDLTKLLVSVDNILDSYQEIHDRMNRAPIAVRIYLEEHGGKIESLAWMRRQIARELGYPS